MDATIIAAMIAAISALFGMLMKLQQDRINEKDARIKDLESDLRVHTDTLGKTSDALQSLTAAIKESGVIGRGRE